MARVQAQIQGARVNTIHNPRLVCGTVPPPSSRQTASATPATRTPTRQTSDAPLAGLSQIADTSGTQSDRVGTQFDETEWAS
jgi:hypothetical protein